MSLISLADVTKDLGGKKVLDGITVEIHDGERIGLIGRNGCGKTSLLRTITGDLEPDAGTVQKKKSLRVGYLPQRPHVPRGVTTWEAALEPFAELRRIEGELERVGHAMDGATGAELESLVERQSELQERYADLGGYTYEPRAEAALIGVGLRREHFDQPVERLSGGEKNRLGLAKLLLADPDLLVLDEPTNYLDIHAVHWLEEFLRGSPRSFLVVSHDRYFLDRTVEKIWEQRRGGILAFRGNYSDYCRQRADRDERQAKEYERQQREIARQEEFIRRNIAGQKTKQAQGRRKQLERLERIDAPDRDEEVRIRFVHRERGGDDVLRARGLGKAFGARALFSGLDLDLHRGDRVGIVGANGTGKTTLLRILAGRESADEGEFRLGAGIELGFYDQEHRELDPERTLFDSLREIVPDWTDLEVRNTLAAFLFCEDEVYKRIAESSGGERARVALARIALSGSNFLVLDEPTNHLDLSARGVLEEALEAYEGTLLVVSHDRYLLDRTVEKLLVFEEGNVRLFNGTWSRYAESLREAQADARRREEEARRKDRGSSESRKRRAGSPAKPRRRYSYEELESRIMETEETIERIHREMAAEETYRDAERVKELAAKLERSRSELRDLEEEWATWE